LKKKSLALTALFAIVAAGAFGQQVAAVQTEPSDGSRTPSSGPFDKIWSVALNQFNQSDQWADSITQLTNGTLVAVGADGGESAEQLQRIFRGRMGYRRHAGRWQHLPEAVFRLRNIPAVG